MVYEAIGMDKAPSPGKQEGKKSTESRMPTFQCIKYKINQSALCTWDIFWYCNRKGFFLISMLRFYRNVKGSNLHYIQNRIYYAKPDNVSYYIFTLVIGTSCNQNMFGTE